MRQPLITKRCPLNKTPEPRLILTWLASDRVSVVFDDETSVWFIPYRDNPIVGQIEDLRTIEITRGKALGKTVYVRNCRLFHFTPQTGEHETAISLDGFTDGVAAVYWRRARDFVLATTEEYFWFARRVVEHGLSDLETLEAAGGVA